MAQSRRRPKANAVCECSPTRIGCVSLGNQALICCEAAVSRGARAAITWLPGKKGGDLADRVEARLKRDLNPTAEDIRVRTDGNNVYLIFSGGTQTEWNRAVATARKVDGVKNVFIRLPE